MHSLCVHVCAEVIGDIIACSEHYFDHETFRFTSSGRESSVKIILFFSVYDPGQLQYTPPIKIKNIPGHDQPPHMFSIILL